MPLRLQERHWQQQQCVPASPRCAWLLVASSWIFRLLTVLYIQQGEFDFKIRFQPVVPKAGPQRLTERKAMMADGENQKRRARRESKRIQKDLNCALVQRRIRRQGRSQVCSCIELCAHAEKNKTKCSRITTFFPSSPGALVSDRKL